MIRQLKSREEIPGYLSELGMTGWGVEVGGHTGWFSDKILAGSKLSRLFTVDAWHSDEPGLPEGMTPIQCFYQCAQSLWKYDYRSVLIRQLSVDAAKLFADRSLDFVYIDANHTFEAVTSDIAAWWPKMKPGGVFGGHDYNSISPEVRNAVDAFCAREGLAVSVTELDFWHTFDGKPLSIHSWLVEVPHG